MKTMNTRALLASVVSVLLFVGCGDNPTAPTTESKQSDIQTTLSTTSIRNEETEQANATETEAPKLNTVLSDNLMDFQISFDGKVISVPCSVKDLYDIGCTLNPIYLTNSKAGTKFNIWLDYGNAQISAYGYNFSDNDYDFKTDTNSSDVKITELHIMGKYIESEKIELANGLNLHTVTKEDVESLYGEPSIKTRSTLYYLGDHFDDSIRYVEKELHLLHYPASKKDGDKYQCEHYIAISPLDADGASSFRLSNGEEIADEFYKKFPNQKRQ